MKKITLTLCLWLTFSMSFTQDNQDYTNGNQYVISRYDGGEYIGEIISDDGREILIITQSIGKIYIRKSMISSIKKSKMGKYPTMKITKLLDHLPRDIILQTTHYQ